MESCYAEVLHGIRKLGIVPIHFCRVKHPLQELILLMLYNTLVYLRDVTVHNNVGQLIKQG